MLDDGRLSMSIALYFSRDARSGMRDIMRGFNAKFSLGNHALTHNCAIIVANNILDRASRIRSAVDTSATVMPT